MGRCAGPRGGAHYCSRDHSWGVISTCSGWKELRYLHCKDQRLTLRQRGVIVSLHLETRGLRITAAGGGVGAASQEPRNVCVTWPSRKNGLCSPPGPTEPEKWQKGPSAAGEHCSLMEGPTASAAPVTMSKRPHPPPWLLLLIVPSYSWLQWSYGLQGLIAMACWLLGLSLVLLSLPFTEDAHFTTLSRLTDISHSLCETDRQMSETLSSWGRKAALAPWALPLPPINKWW